jgi:hypothetical protein
MAHTGFNGVYYNDISEKPDQNGSNSGGGKKSKMGSIFGAGSGGRA